MVIGTKTRLVEPGITVFGISGRLHLGNNLVSIEVALKRLIDEGARRMVIDLTELNYIDSAGIGMLVGMNGHMDQSGGLLRIAGASGAVAKTFGLVHMDRILALDDSVDAACGNLAAGGAVA
jgi:anti-sigma B factor antagonist